MRSDPPENIREFRCKYDKLVRLIRKNKDLKDYKRLRKAYDLLVDTFGAEGDREGYQQINSALEVSTIAINEIGLGMTSVLCIFLIRILKKAKISIAEIENEYHKSVALIVTG